MNERIKELANAHLVREEHTEFGWQECHQYSFDEDELTEFTEMIVQECCQALHPILRDQISRGQGVDLIKQHLGVKE